MGINKIRLSVCLLAITTHAKEPLPTTMAAIGDSITAGTVAQFTTQSWYHPQDLIGMLYRLFHTKITGSSEPAERKDLSWSTGFNKAKWVHSHYTMLSYLAETTNQKPIKLYNAAVSQQDSGDTAQQLDRIVEWSVQNHQKNMPDYVTVFIGANDLCNDHHEPSTNTETYRKRMVSLVHQILVQERNTKVLLLELPDVNYVWDFAKGKTLSRLKNFQSCSVLWRSANLCQSVLSDLSPSARRQSVNQNREYNRVLQETVQQFSQQSNRYGHDRVRLAKGFFNLKLNFDDLSVDCFHPNYRGQSKIAWKSFSQSWWQPQFKSRLSGYEEWILSKRNHLSPKPKKRPMRPPHRR